MNIQEIGSAGSPKCLTKGCTRTSSPSNYARGLCLVCYSKANKMVKAGTTTWKELEDLGLALPGIEGSADPFTRAFDEAKKGK